MVRSLLLRCVRACGGVRVRAAIALGVCGWLPGCGGDKSITQPPPAAVLTTVTVNIDGSVAVGQESDFDISALDQFGRAMANPIVTNQLSDTIHAVFFREQDFGDFVLGAVPGTIDLTATVTVGATTKSATRSITVTTSDSGVVNVLGAEGSTWRFRPVNVSVTRSAGDAQVAFNLYNGSHTVHWDSQPSGGAVVDIDSTTAVEVTRHFTVAGTYQYHCLIHTEMSGTIIVE
jgi:plastocyanin